MSKEQEVKKIERREFLGLMLTLSGFGISLNGMLGIKNLYDIVSSEQAQGYPNGMTYEQFKKLDQAVSLLDQKKVKAAMNGEIVLTKEDIKDPESLQNFQNLAKKRTKEEHGFKISIGRSIGGTITSGVGLLAMKLLIEREKRILKKDKDIKQ